jgi:hypothetical protein
MYQENDFRFVITRPTKMYKFFCLIFLEVKIIMRFKQLKHNIICAKGSCWISTPLQMQYPQNGSQVSEIYFADLMNLIDLYLLILIYEIP